MISLTVMASSRSWIYKSQSQNQYVQFHSRNTFVDLPFLIQAFATNLIMTFTVSVAGITGKFARLVVNNLCKSSDVQIRGFCRNASKLPDRFRQSPASQSLKASPAICISPDSRELLSCHIAFWSAKQLVNLLAINQDSCDQYIKAT